MAGFLPLRLSAHLRLDSRIACLLSRRHEAAVPIAVPIIMGQQGALIHSFSPFGLPGSRPLMIKLAIERKSTHDKHARTKEQLPHERSTHYT